MTIVYCDCDDCYNNDGGRCELDTISMTGRMTGGGWLTLCDDYQEINREDFEPHESEVHCICTDVDDVEAVKDLLPRAEKE